MSAPLKSEPPTGDQSQDPVTLDERLAAVDVTLEQLRNVLLHVAREESERIRSIGTRALT